MKISQLSEEKKLFENGNRLDFSEVVFSNSIIEIFGKNNHIFFASGSKISESKISIYGDNNAIYFGKSKSSPTKIILDIWHNSSCFFGGGVTAPIRVAANVGYWGGSTHPWKQEDTERNSVKNTVADIDYQRFGGSFLKFEQYDKNLKACHSSQERIDYLKLMDTFSYDRFVARD